MEYFLGAVAALIVVIAGTGGYLLNRLKSLEKRDETRNAEAVQTALGKEKVASDKADELEKQVELLKPMAAKVPELERQLSVLTKTVSDLQTWQEDAKQKLDARESENAALRTENADLKTKLHDAGVREAALTLALEKVGGERLERADREPSESGPESSNETPDSAHETNEVK